MHADRDDAPYYLEAKQYQSKRLVVITTIGSAIAFGAIMLLPGPSRIEAPSIAPKPDANLPQQQMYAMPARVQSAPAPQAAAYEPNQPRPESIPARQTSFNNTNYVPRGADNVLSFPEPVEVKQPEKKGVKVVVVGTPEPRLRDYCPYKEGSIEHRNCRMTVDRYSRNKE